MKYRHIVVGPLLIGAAGSPALADAGEETSSIASVEAVQAEGKGTETAKPVPTKTAKPVESKPAVKLIPRWRVQYDVADVKTPAALNSPANGGSEILRRAYIGVDAKFRGGVSARAELDFAASDPEFVDLYLAYDKGPLNITLGQHKPFTNLDDMTSDLYTSFAERAGFSTAFNYTRRLGASATYAKGPVLLSGGVFTDNALVLNDAKTNSIGLDGRAVWMPKMGKTQLHLGGSIHWRDRNDLTALGTRYRQRPFTRTVDTRFIATPSMKVEKELSYGLEAAVLNGPFHAVGEVHWMNADRLGLSTVTMFGGYAEAGVFLTGETRGYKGGAFGGTNPKKAVGEGGFGAWQVNLRYDYLNLNDAGAGIKGGTQNGYMTSLVWIPTKNTRVIGNYARLDYKDAVIPLPGGARNYGVDSFVVRFQLNY